MKRVMMERYVTERSEKKTANSVDVEIASFQGEHRDWYLVEEVKSGRYSLLYKGVLHSS